MSMVGKPHDLTADQSREWDTQSARYALEVEALRACDERPFRGAAGHHSRGDFATVTFGIGYGGGRKVRITLVVGPQWCTDSFQLSGAQQHQIWE